MIKKALATAGIAATIVGMGATSAFAAPAQDAGQAKKEGNHNVVCDGKDAGDKATWMGLLADGALKLPILDSSPVIGLCKHESAGDQGGGEGGEGGGDQQTPKPGEGSFPAAL